ncbi:SGNH/GDSL hydrolase family protein [Bombilactobacillus bombi]|uniref:SGNH/GDSL hydrolase family protein n=1 Tax=Bombilactobacillus bombi TaxID=1303590 RepID=UPI0013C2CF70|nr:SGNH/GDSL hydrolase family protein [Bombilactobacillus bombi]
MLVIIFAGRIIWSSQPVQAQQKSFPVTAVGDSLTYGVGDPTKRGGYCYLIQKPLKRATKQKVHVDNFGISGETSKQILKRVQSKDNLRQALKKSRIVIITAGGNDVMHALRARGLRLSQSQLLKYQDAYTANMNNMIKEIRSLNSRAPIYIYGIYNPYAIYFKKVPGMKMAIDNWNQNTRLLTQDYHRVHFVDISALAQPKKLQYSKKNQETTNPLLYTKDYFHPNRQGYQLMTDKLWKKLQATKTEWRP